MHRKARTPLLIESLEGRALLSVAYIDHGSHGAMVSAETVRLDLADGQASILGRVSFRGDQDMYRLDPDASGDVRLTLSELGRNPVHVDALAGSGRRLAQLPTRDQTSSVIFHVNGGDPVFLRVRGTRRGIGVYQIHMIEPAAALSTDPIPQTVGTPIVGPGPTSSLSPPSNVMPAPAQSSSPTPLVFDATNHAHVSGTVASQNDPQVFSFTAPKSGRITFDFRRTGSVPLTLKVTDASNKTVLALDTDIPSYIAFFQANAGQTYTVRVASRADGSAPYSLTVYEK